MDRRWRLLVRERLGFLNVEPGRESDVVDELAQDAADQHRELVAAGMPDGEAERLALAPLADVSALARELARADRRRPSPEHSRRPAPPEAPRGQSMLRAIPGDVRYAIRLLRRSPGFAAAAIVTLALGIGANSAIFSVLRAVILNPPPYRDPSHVVALINVRDGAATGSIVSASLPDYEDWQRQLTSFESLGLLSGWTFNVTDLELPERIFGARVTGSLFPLLGTAPLLGRTIEPADDVAGGDEVLVLGYRVWQRVFGGDSNVIGHTIMLEGRPHIVIGVMPPRFRFPTDDTEVWAAMKDNMAGMPRDGRFMAAVGRLKPTVTQAAAQGEIDALESRLDQLYPGTNRGWRVRLVGVHESVAGESRPPLLLLAGAVGFVLLIACGNVANLLLARATSRRRETAVRLALGAGRARIVAQWVTENVVLALLGGALGIAIALAGVRSIVVMGPADVPRLDEAAVDSVVLAFTFGIAILAGVLPAIIPGVLAARSSTHAALKDGAGSYGAGGPGRVGAALIVAEVALAMTLAVAGALLLASFARLTSVQPGFDADRILTLKTFLTPPRYRGIQSGQQYIQQALDRIAAMSGVEAVAAVSQLPMGDASSTLRFDIDGREMDAAQRPSASYRSVSASYFATMGIPVVRGRAFTSGDRDTTDWVAVVNEAFANRVTRGNPIGRRIRWAMNGAAAPDTRWLTIVGVVADVKSNGLDQPEAPAVYTPFTQRELSFLRWTTFVVRTASDPLSYARPIRQELARIDPMQPVYQVVRLEDVIAQSVASRRFHTWLIAAFAAVAIVLASVGVYGTIGYWVAARAREIGVRLALGATARRIALLIVGRAALLTGCGIALGVVMSAAATRTLTALLFGVRPFELAAVASVAVLIAFVGLAAAYVPARRAGRLDPLSVIRGE